VRRQVEDAGSVSLSTLLAELAMPQVRTCPACPQHGRREIARFEGRTYWRCEGCGLVYLTSFVPQREYTEDYFFNEYERQYGRTYLEDAAHIRDMGRRRCDHISRLIEARGRLVDLGCAYGPFLTAAAERGFEPVGVDVSRAAVSYVADELGFEAYDADLEELATGGTRPAGLQEGSASVVTMWYVIEHIASLGDVLSFAAGMLGRGGVFAFATPNMRGISGRSNRLSFLERSPADHLTVWSPAVASRVLESYGFEVVRTVVTGHHPERFPLVGGLARFRPVGGLLRGVSRLFGLGDTFEVYARKKQEGRV
jgi:2-polyprenyl-3-methyl-5-hydroxy-6-metoxy-1,4-benzoquinol methylase